MNLDQVLSEWKADAVVDQINIEKEIFRTPNLHAKYLEVYVFMKAKLAATDKKVGQLKYLKRKYYRGEMTREELEKHSWTQFQGLKPSNSELQSMFDMDPDLNELEEKLAYFKTGVTSLEYILKQIGIRDYSLKSVIEYRKFCNGN